MKAFNWKKALKVIGFITGAIIILLIGSVWGVSR